MAIKDHYRKIGLRYGLERDAEVRRLNPKAAEWLNHLQTVAESFFGTTTEEVLSSSDKIKCKVDEYLVPLAAAIWRRMPNGGSRPWLLKPREDLAHRLYDKDLYWTDAEDRELLYSTFCELAMERALKYVKEHRVKRKPRASDKACWTPIASTRNGASTNVLNVRSADLKCFAAGPCSDHQDASELKKQGIWLGSVEHPDEVITGLSWNGVVDRYYRSTEGGRQREDDAEPKVNKRHKLEHNKQRQCLTCLGVEGAEAEALEIENVAFAKGDMEKTIWRFKCKLNGRWVFALLRSDNVRVDSEYSYNGWSFWMAGGGYARNVFLGLDRKVPTYECEEVPPTRRMRSAPSCGSGGKQVLYEDDSDDSECLDEKPDPSSESAFRSAPFEAGESSLKKRQASDGPMATHSHKRTTTLYQPTSGASGRWSFDGAYDVTPGFEAPRQRPSDIDENRSAGPTSGSGSTHSVGTRAPQRSPFPAAGSSTASPLDCDTNTSLEVDSATKSARQLNAHSLPTPPISASHPQILGNTSSNSSVRNHIPSYLPESSTATERSQPPTTANTTPAPLGSRLKVWVKIHNLDGRRIVSLNTGMTVQEVFVAVQLAFGGEMTGGIATKVSFTLPRDIFDEPIVVARNDEPTWLALLEMVEGSSSLPILRGEVFT